MTSSMQQVLFKFYVVIYYLLNLYCLLNHYSSKFPLLYGLQSTESTNNMVPIILRKYY